MSYITQLDEKSLSTRHYFLCMLDFTCVVCRGNTYMGLLFLWDKIFQIQMTISTSVLKVL